MALTKKKKQVKSSKKHSLFSIGNTLSIFNGRDSQLHSLAKEENLIKILSRLFVYSVLGFLAKFLSRIFKF